MRMKGKWIWLCLIVFILLTVLIDKPFMKNMDDQVILFFEGIRTPLLNRFFLIVTEFGSIKILLPLCVIAALYCFIKRRYVEILLLMLVLWGTRGINAILKKWIERERPDFHPLIDIGEYSFPSAHVMNSTAVYGFLFCLLIYLIRVKRYRTAWYALPITIIALVAISRIYMGVHYLTDVVGGVAAGLVCLLSVVYFWRLIKKPERPYNVYD